MNGKHSLYRVFLLAVACSVAATSGARADDAVGDLERISEGFSRIAERVRPTVVSIRSVSVNDEVNDELRRMFGDKNFQPIPISGTGSGVIFDDKGHIVTNFHVVDSAGRIEVTLADGREYEARLIGADRMTDVAVIKIDAENLTPAAFGNSDAVRVGHLVLAIGSPFKFGHSVSHGIISAVGRSNVDVDIDYKNWLQTDAAINPGNSGGPLINTRGEVIGISVAIATESGGYQGVGFAIPSNVAARVADVLRRGERPVRGYLGVAIRPVNRTAADAYGMDSVRGALLETIFDDTPAAKAGLKAEDIILAIDGQEIRRLEELQERVALLSPGTKSVFKVWRQKRVQEVTVEISEQPENFRTNAPREELRHGFRRNDKSDGESEDRGQPTGTSSATPLEPSGEFFEGLGMEAASLTPELRAKYGVEGDIESGVLVIRVDPLGGAYAGDLRRGCVITHVNDERVESLTEFKGLLEKLEDETGVRMRVRVARQSFRTTVKLK